MSDKVDINYLKDNINFLDLANYFEEDKIQVSYNHIKFCCPIHEEKTPSFVYNIEKKFCKCFGCGKSLDLIDYVKLKKNTGFTGAIEFILQFMGIEKNSFGLSKTVSYKKQLRALNSLDRKKENTFVKFTEQDIQQMKEMRGSFWLSDGFLPEILDLFQVGFDPVDNRITVPIRDENNILCGVTGRTVYQPTIEDDRKVFRDSRGTIIPKWRHYKNSNVNENFYNIYNGILESKSKKNAIIIVEGPKDVIWLHQQGFKNVIACLTNKISNVQKGLLLKNFMDVYLFLDGDSGGEIGKSAIYNEIKGYFNIYEVKSDKGKDPDNYSKEELEVLLKNATKI